MRNKRTTSRASEETSGANVFTAPTSGLNNATFTRGTTRDAAKYMDTLNKLAGYGGTQPWSQSTVSAYAMINLVELVSAEPTTPFRKYYIAVPANTAVANPRT